MQYPALVIVPVLFALVGLVLIIWPDRIRKYDERMTKLVKTRDKYHFVARFLGGFFILAGVAFLVLMLTGSMK